ncbi:hypothetical protein [Helicobacter sp. T3_23-1056]
MLKSFSSKILFGIFKKINSFQKAWQNLTQNLVKKWQKSNKNMAFL